MEDAKKPWYKSIKKVLGVSFAIAVLVGGIIEIAEGGDTKEVLELWAQMSYVYIGLKVVGGVAKGISDGRNKS